MLVAALGGSPFGPIDELDDLDRPDPGNGGFGILDLVDQQPPEGCDRSGDLFRMSRKRHSSLALSRVMG